MSNHICPNCGLDGDTIPGLQKQVARLERDNVALAAEKASLQVTVATLRRELREAKQQLEAMQVSLPGEDGMVGRPSIRN